MVVSIEFVYKDAPLISAVVSAKFTPVGGMMTSVEGSTDARGVFTIALSQGILKDIVAQKDTV